MPIQPRRPPWFPPIAPTTDTELAAIELAMRGAPPERLFNIAESSLARARSLLQISGSQADASVFSGNLAWAYVALRRLLSVEPVRSAPARASGTVDIMQATRDIARGA